MAGQRTIAGTDLWPKSGFVSSRPCYYACAGRAQKGPTKCEGCALPMNALDTLVLDQLADRVFRPDRLTGFLDRSKDAETQRRQRLGRLRAELAETEGAITQLLILVEKRKLDLDDPALAEQLQHQKAERRRLQQEIDLTSALASSSPLSITPAKLDRLSAVMRAALKQGPSDLRRAYLRMFVNRVMVSRREIRISGPKGALAQSRGR